MINFINKNTGLPDLPRLAKKLLISNQIYLFLTQKKVKNTFSFL